MKMTTTTMVVMMMMATIVTIKAIPYKPYFRSHPYFGHHYGVYKPRRSVPDYRDEDGGYGGGVDGDYDGDGGYGDGDYGGYGGLAVSYKKKGKIIHFSDHPSFIHHSIGSGGDGGSGGYGGVVGGDGGDGGDGGNFVSYSGGKDKYTPKKWVSYQKSYFLGPKRFTRYAKRSKCDDKPATNVFDIDIGNGGTGGIGGFGGVLGGEGGMGGSGANVDGFLTALLHKPKMYRDFDDHHRHHLDIDVGNGGGGGSGGRGGVIGGDGGDGGNGGNFAYDFKKIYVGDHPLYDERGHFKYNIMDGYKPFYVKGDGFAPKIW